MHFANEPLGRILVPLAPTVGDLAGLYPVLVVVPFFVLLTSLPARGNTKFKTSPGCGTSPSILLERSLLLKVHCYILLLLIASKMLCYLFPLGSYSTLRK
jgi:hypothetical protein